MKYVRYTLAAMLLSASSLARAEASADCERVARNAVVSPKPTPVLVSNEHWTEVVLPETVESILADQRNGMRYREIHLDDRLYFRVDDPAYNALVTVHGKSGKGYLIHLKGVEGCPDVSVTMQEATASTQTPTAPPKHAAKPLMEYMLSGETPPGYSLVDMSKEDEQPVLKQGSVYFYPALIYRGYNYTGYVLRVVNAGRTPFEVAIDAIDFESPSMLERIGKVKEIAMLPADRRLDPAPEYAVDSYAAANEGLVFMVVRRHTGERYGR